MKPDGDREVNEWTIQDLLEEFGANATTIRSPNDIIKFFKARKANEQINWKNEIEKKAKTPRQKAIDQLEKEIEQKTRELMKLQQEEKEFNERYKENWKDIEWVIDNYESGNTTHQDISLVDRVMTDLYRQPYGTEIPFHLMNQNQLAEAGERLKAWYEKTIGKRELRDRIRVSFWLKNGDFKQLPLHQNRAPLDTQSSDLQHACSLYQCTHEKA